MRARAQCVPAGKHNQLFRVDGANSHIIRVNPCNFFGSHFSCSPLDFIRVEPTY